MLLLAGVMGLLVAGVAMVGLADMVMPPVDPGGAPADDDGTQMDDPETGGDATVPGTPGDDLLTGGAGRDQIGGYGGADSLTGGAGDDALHGNDGDDTLRGSDGADALFGADGGDSLTGDDDAARDYLNGGDGDDTLVAGGDDWLNGGAGADRFVVQAASAGPAVIDDFDSTTDELVVMHGDSVPDLTVHTGPEGATLWADGQIVAAFPGLGGFDAALVRLVRI